MATLGYLEPQISTNGQEREPDIYSGASTGTLKRGDFVKLSSGNLVKCATNDNAAIVGMMIHGSVDVPVSTTATDATLFGVSTVNTALTPAEPLNAHAIMFHNSQPVELSCVQARAAANVGTTFGITLDGTTGFFVADNTQANKPMTLLQYVDGAPGVKGAVGDIGARGLFVFTASTLAV